MNCQLDYGLASEEETRTQLTLTSAPQLGATQYKLQSNDFLNAVYGPAALELLKRAGYQVLTPWLLNKNLSEALEFGT